MLRSDPTAAPRYRVEFLRKETPRQVAGLPVRRQLLVSDHVYNAAFRHFSLASDEDSRVLARDCASPLVFPLLEVAFFPSVCILP